MSDDKPPVEFSKGVNGLEKVVLREVRGSSAEVRFITSFLPAQDRLVSAVFVPLFDALLNLKYGYASTLFRVSLMDLFK